MNPADLLPAATGAGGALFVALCWVAALAAGKQVPEATHKEIVTRLEQQNRDLTVALERERERADTEREKASAAVAAAATVRDVLLLAEQKAAAR
jgi:hypothetical protein